MSSAPEAYMKFLDALDKRFKHYNAPVVALTKRIDKLERASTKAIGVMTQTKGMMIGFVADLDLLGGAFGRVKRVLGNLLLPEIDKTEGKFSKFTRLFGTWTGMLKEISGPMRENQKAFRKKATLDKSVLNMANMRTSTLTKEIDLSGTLAKNPPQFKEMAEYYEQVNRETDIKPPDFGKMWKRAMQTPVSEVFEMEKFATMQNMFAIKRGAKPETELKRIQTGITHATEIQQEIGAAPKALTGLQPLPPAPKSMVDFTKGFQKLAKPAKFFNKEVMNPLKQVMSGGIGLGFQTQIIMGLMQAFSNMFTVFQPVIDVVGILAEMIGIGFMPIVEALLKALTSPTMLNLIGMLTNAISRIMVAVAPLIPVFIRLIEIALIPVIFFVEILAAIIEPLSPLFELLAMSLDMLGPILEFLAPAISFVGKVISWLITLGLLPLMYAIYGVGMFVAALIQIFSFGAIRAMDAWQGIMGPMIGGMLSTITSPFMGGGGGGVSTSATTTTQTKSFGKYREYQSGSAYIPYTGLYKLHQGEEVNREGGNNGGVIINIDGGIWVQDLDEFVTMIGRKLQLYRG